MISKYKMQNRDNLLAASLKYLVNAAYTSFSNCLLLKPVSLKQGFCNRASPTALKQGYNFEILIVYLPSLSLRIFKT